MNKKVAIVGFATISATLAPYDDEDYDIWILNEMAGLAEEGKRGIDFITRWDALFQMHPRWDFTKLLNHSDPDHWEWLRSYGGPNPIYMLEEHEDVPASKKYPLESILDELVPSEKSRSNMKYFTNTVSYMVALAIYMGYEEIAIYGIEMANDTEYKFQRGSFSFWCGVAMGRGIDIITAEKSMLLGKNTRMYGYESQPRLNRSNLQYRSDKAFHQAKLHAEKILQIQEALKGLEEKLSTTIRPKRREVLEQAIGGLREEEKKEISHHSYYEGIHSSIKELVKEFDHLSNPNDRAVTYGEIDDS